MPIYFINARQAADPTFTVTDSSTNAKLSNNPAYKMEYTYSMDETTDIRAIEYVTIIGDKLYYAFFYAQRK